MVVKYVDKWTKKFWKILGDFSENYEKLKKNIFDTYSKTLLNNKLTIAQLVKLVKKLAKDIIEDKKTWTLNTKSFEL